ncbi:MAG TPA: hypothetical protein VGH19_02000 [Verrucomicrobiae bacterium]
MFSAAKHMLVFLLLFTLSPLNGQAMIVQLEGYVNADLLLAGERQILWSLSYSGVSSYELISLDAQNGKEQWRVKMEDRPHNVVVGGQDVFYFISGDFLTAARLSSSQVLWRTNLSAVPQQVKALPPKPSSRKGDSLVEPISVLNFGYSLVPNRFNYSEIQINGPLIVIDRKGLNGSGCVWDVCFQDWLVIDRRVGKIVDGGPGEILAHGKNLVVGNQEAAFQFKDGVKVPMPKLAEMHKSMNPFSRQGKRNDVNDWVLVSRTHTTTGPVAAFNVKSQTTVDLKLGHRDPCQQGWIVLKDGFLRYSEYHSSGFPDAKTTTEKFWIELYNFEGNLRAERTTEAFKDFWTSSLGVNSRGTVLLDVKDSLVTVEIPSLEMKRWQTKPGASFHMTESGDRMVCVRGDWSAQTMAKASERREVIITGVDAITFAPIWEHREKVTAKKLR